MMFANACYREVSSRLARFVLQKYLTTNGCVIIMEIPYYILFYINVRLFSFVSVYVTNRVKCDGVHKYCHHMLQKVFKLLL